MDHFCPQVQHFRLFHRGTHWALSRDQLEPKVVVSFETSPGPTTSTPLYLELYLPLLVTGTMFSPCRLCCMGTFGHRHVTFALLIRGGAPWALSRGQLEPKVVVSFETSPWPTTFAPPILSSICHFGAQAQQFCHFSYVVWTTCVHRCSTFTFWKGVHLG